MGKTDKQMRDEIIADLPTESSIELHCICHLQEHRHDPDCPRCNADIASSRATNSSIVPDDEGLTLKASIWKRQPYDECPEGEWVLELSGCANDCAFISRHTEPLTTALEDVAGLPSSYDSILALTQSLADAESRASHWQIVAEMADDTLADERKRAGELENTIIALQRKLEIASIPIETPE